MSTPLNVFRRLDVEHEPLWGEWDKFRETDAAMGSRKLRESLHELFGKWEREHGFQEGAGAMLLPAGYTP